MLEIILLIMATVGIIEGIRLTHAVLLFADPVGPGRFLLFISCLLFICASILLFRTIRRHKAGQKEVALSLYNGVVGRVLILLFLYAALITYLGYVIASVIFFVWVLHLFGQRSWIRCTLIGLTITICFYIVFIHFANLPIPQGRWLY